MLPFVMENKKRWDQMQEKYQIYNLIRTEFFKGIGESERKQCLLKLSLPIPDIIEGISQPKVHLLTYAGGGQKFIIEIGKF